MASWFFQKKKKVECKELRRVEWLVSKKKREMKTGEDYKPSYGCLLELNQSRVILDLVGEEILSGITKGILDLLDTSSAIYETNGDYACGIFSSGWCRFLDLASRNLCKTKDNKKALASGKWLCHESCWTNTSKVAIATKKPVDIQCSGGIRLYGIPIFANNKVIGSINFGYGEPPKDKETLEKIAKKYQVKYAELKKLSNTYESRPAFFKELAKYRLETAAKLIGILVERGIARKELQEKIAELERFNKLTVGREEKMTELKEEIAKLKKMKVKK